MVQNNPFLTHLSSQLSLDKAARSNVGKWIMTVKWLAEEPKMNNLYADLSVTKNSTGVISFEWKSYSNNPALTHSYYPNIPYLNCYSPISISRGSMGFSASSNRPMIHKRA